MTDISILVDTREQNPYEFAKWEVQTHQAGLPAGDYSLIGFEDRAAVERKSLDDLIGCLMGKERERFERELAKGRAYEMFAVVVEADLQDVASGRYRSKMRSHAALQSITALYIRYGTPFLFCGDQSDGEYMTFSLLSKYVYEIEKRFRQVHRIATEDWRRCKPL